MWGLFCPARGLWVVEDARGVLFQRVTGGAAVGGAHGCRFESVYAGGMVGEAKYCFVGGVGGGEVSPGVPGGGSVSVVTDGSAVGCVAGDEYGKGSCGARGWRVACGCRVGFR